MLIDVENQDPNSPGLIGQYCLLYTIYLVHVHKIDTLYTAAHLKVGPNKWGLSQVHNILIRLHQNSPATHTILAYSNMIGAVALDVPQRASKK